ncbi:phenylalanine--tRNA ligase subunit beta [bacterium]|nr:phenylalanine--tRNA ligase subunit beta [bacterium]
MIISFNWLKELLDDSKLTVSKLSDVLTFSGIEVESTKKIDQDTVMELGLTPNRGDCLNMQGVARDVRAAMKKSYKAEVTKTINGKGKIADWISVEVKDNNRCPRYCARVISGVKIKPSPKWLQLRVENLGVRSINNIVDATNYVMLESGQPFHAFDHKFIRDKKIIVKTPSSRIKFTTLDEVEREVAANDLLICDNKGPIAVGGVMGGQNSEVKNDTTDIVLESAYFNPVSVRLTSKKLGVSTESSRRFERGVDPNNTLNAMHRLTQLILEIAGGEATKDWIDIYSKKINCKKIKLTTDETNWLLGTEIKSNEIKNILLSLGMKLTAFGNNAFIVEVPTFRPDIERAVDLIEEVARIYGYAKIKETLPVAESDSIEKPLDYDLEIKAKTLLSNCGFCEALNYSFVAPEEAEAFHNWLGCGVALENPLAKELSVLRSSLLPSLLNNVKVNYSRQATSVKLFELRKVFVADKKSTREIKLISGVLCGDRYDKCWSYSKDKVDFYDVKGTVEAILEGINVKGAKFEAANVDFLNSNCAASIIYGGKNVGVCGQLHPAWQQKWDIPEDVYLFEINFEEIAEIALNYIHEYSELSRYPFVERDTALLVDKEITVKEILTEVEKVNSPLINSVKIFDLYDGKGIPSGKKSVAFNVCFLSKERTLTDGEVTKLHQNIIDNLKGNLSAEIR